MGLAHIVEPPWRTFDEAVKKNNTFTTVVQSKKHPQNRALLTPADAAEQR